MTTAIDKAIADGIRLASWALGSRKVRCPECSEKRKNKREPCLSVTVKAEAILACCHNCGFKKGYFDDDERRDFAGSGGARHRHRVGRPPGVRQHQPRWY